MSTARILQILAESSAESWLVYGTDLHELVDTLQKYAESVGLVDQISQDAVQEIIAAPFAVVRMMIEAEEAPLQPEPDPEPVGREYRTPQSTIDSFWHVVRLGDEKQLASWLADHPLDAPQLHKIWKQKCTEAA